MKPKILARQSLFSANAILIYLAAGYFLLQIAAVVLGSRYGYGYFIDEFYYITCAKRLAWGYVDHPPLAPFLLRLVLWTLGDALVAIRILPALAGALTLILTGLLARRFGVGTWGQFIAALAMAVAPMFQVMSGFFSMNPFESLLWAACLYVVTILIQEDNPRLWLIIGVLLGLGLLNKHTLIVYVGSLCFGLLFIPARKYLLTTWFWIGMLIAGMLLLPNLVWQVYHGFPSLEFYRNATVFKNIDTPPIEIVGTQMFSMNPITTPIWLAGLGWLLIARQAKAYRFFGISYLLLLAIMIVSRSSRPDRMLAAYPVLMVTGTLMIEQGIRRFRRLRFSKSVIPVLLLFGGFVVMPFAIPIMPPEQLARIGSPVEIEQGISSKLPQWLADRFGWEEFVAMVAAAYQTLPSEEQAECMIFAMNYGQAGALDLFGAKYGLPRAIAAHNTYWLWGHGDFTGDVVIVTGGEPDEIRQFFQDVTLAGSVQCPYCRPSARYKTVYIAKGLRMPIEQLWARLKYFE